MGATNLCPSARALVEAIILANPTATLDVGALVRAHSDFMLAAKGCPRAKKSDMRLACEASETALFRALKGIGDAVLAPQKDESEPE